MSIKSSQAHWGGTNTSKDYSFQYVTDPVDPPIDLTGSHAIDTPNQNLTEPVVRRYTKRVKGRIVDREEVIRPADLMSMTMNIMFGEGLDTPLLRRARSGGKATIAALRECAEPGQKHAYIFPNCIMNPPARVNGIITIEDTVMASWQTEARVEEEIVLLELGNFFVRDIGDAVYGITVLDDECSTFSDDQYQDMIAVGGAGGASDAPMILRTSDRFATLTPPLTNPGTLGTVATSVASWGDVVLVGFSDKPVTSVASSTLGGTLFSQDGGANFAIDVNLTAPIYAVGKFGGTYLAAGGVGGGAAKLFSSLNGLSWSEVSSSVFPATETFTGMAVDEDAGRVYLTTNAGKVFVGVYNGGTLSFTSIVLPGSPTSLRSVSVLSRNRAVVAGASGYMALTKDAGVTWSLLSSGVSGTIGAVHGREFRIVFGASNKTYENSLLTENQFSVIPVQNGATVSGNICAIASPSNTEYNFFVIGTDTGDIVIAKDFSPFS